VRADSAGREIDAGQDKLEMLKNIREERRSRKGRFTIL
jgi:hypothetical protein